MPLTTMYRTPGYIVGNVTPSQVSFGITESMTVTRGPVADPYSVALGNLLSVDTRQSGKSTLISDSVQAQLEAIPQDNVVPIIFSMNIEHLIGQDSLKRIHRCGLPETILLDIYMSWRTIYKRPPSTNADFAQFYRYFQDQLELIYEGIGLQLPIQTTPITVYSTLDSMIAGEMDFLIGATYQIGAHAELHLGATLAQMPDHEFVFDSVREVPGVDSLSLTMVHDPRMVTPGEDDPMEMGPTGPRRLLKDAVVQPLSPPRGFIPLIVPPTDLSGSSSDDTDRYGF